ncbi:4'-phosphopantetheinyl transferase family protein [Streptomyces cyaneofuscatus]|uniref:4'-phosphopantetheinyl transferase family protein n=1 Tax=Streptomyces cyaneofuscatus TaxID=66883 RepID=UPI0013D96D6F|nr:4'-phosphopantetheinyl transferase superfamily protein [Streptomyces cyaneofuscatus]NDZ68055.1 4'-phosphopantetheinyl transferase superfamily protein [Streptomyces cyaneofuscatus]
MRSGSPRATEGTRLDLLLLRLPAAGGPGAHGPGALSRAADLDALDDAERRRAASFRRPADGLLYAAAHAALRRLLGHRLGIAPRQVRFVREPCPGCGGPHGRPAPAHPGEPPLHFSLSHSGGLALIAIASTAVGVDVQRLPGAGTVEVCSAALHPGERAELAQEPPQTRPALFGGIWARKEAYLKGLGTGLGRSPAADYLGADSRRRPPGWSFVDVPCGPGHRAAAALPGEPPASVAVRPLPFGG